MSNPNPQALPKKFRGVRELGYREFLLKQNPLD
jgi:hypothetical protein